MQMSKEKEIEKTKYKLVPIRCLCGEYVQYYASVVDRLVAQGMDKKTALENCGLPRNNWFSPPASGKHPEYEKKIGGSRNVCCYTTILTTIDVLAQTNFYHDYKTLYDGYFASSSSITLPPLPSLEGPI